MKRKIIVTVIALVIAAATAHWYYSDRGRFTTAPEYTGLVRSVLPDQLFSPTPSVAWISIMAGSGVS